MTRTTTASIKDTFERHPVRFEVFQGKGKGRAGKWYWRAKRSSDIVADGGVELSTAKK